MIEVRDLSKNFGKTTALDGVNITVQQGSIFGLMGSNGAGKSTLLRILSGIYRQDRGTAEVCGRRSKSGFGFFQTSCGCQAG